MFFSWLWHKPTDNQEKVFAAVSPIIERNFPKSRAFITRHNNEVVFDCGWKETISPCKEITHEPDEAKLEALCAYLNNLSLHQNSRIYFQIWCEDFGVQVPMGIVATWHC